MAWFRKKSKEPRFGDSAPKNNESLAHLREFRESRTAVSAYFEAATANDLPAILLVAGDGEWTRRPVKDFSAAQKIARDLELALYEAAVTGYPRQMREWNLRHRNK
ncbi:MAG: oxidoreductase [Arcanobacterium sp.]|nr:oxidoreductase [Arcanobacterium sp.]